MKWFRPLVYVVVVLAALGSCQKTINDDLEDVERLVVDGWIDSDGHPMVILSRSFSPMNPDATDLSDLVVRWAEVTISDGEREEVMIGRIDRTLTPPFVYTTAGMTGESGRTYTIKASYGGKSVSAQCTMPVPPEIERVEVVPVPNSKDMREIKVTFTPRPGGCYQLCVYDPEKGGRALPCFMGAYKAGGEISGEVTLTAARPKTETSQEDYTPYYKAGSQVMVILTATTPEVWRFWNQYDELTAFGGNVFLAGAVSLEGNVTGGYGIWNARGVAAMRVAIE